MGDENIYDVIETTKVNVKEPIFGIEKINKSFYKFINDIQSKNILIYVIIISIFITIFGEFNLNIGHIIGIVFGIIIIYYFNDYYTIQYEDEIQTTEMKLNSIIPKPSFFYIDATIIDLVYNLLEFSNFNPSDFAKMIYNIDNLFKLELDFEKGVANCDFIYDNVRQLKKDALNNMVNILNSIPAIDSLRKKFTEGIKTMQIYLQDHLDKIKGECLKQRNVNGGISSESHLMENVNEEPMDKYDLF